MSGTAADGGVTQTAEQTPDRSTGPVPCLQLRPTRHEVVCADARHWRPGASRPRASLVVTSPPYPMIAMWDDLFTAADSRIAGALATGDGGLAFELMHLQLDQVWDQLPGWLEPGALVCINIGDATRSLGGSFRLYSNHSRIVSALTARGFEQLPGVIWRKATNAPTKFLGSGMLPAGAYVTLEHEHILIFRLGGRRRFRAMEAEDRRASAYFWEERNLWFSDQWDLGGVRQTMGDAESARSRTAAFPLELAFRLICMHSLEGDVVLDPFLGTGTTTLAAMAAGRSSLGLETDAGLLPIVSTRIVGELGVGDGGSPAAMALGTTSMAPGTTPARDPAAETDHWTVPVDAALAPVNRRQYERVQAHHRAVQPRSGRGDRRPRYRNTLLDTPVVTRQERNLRLPVVTGARVLQSGADGFMLELGHAALGNNPPAHSPDEAG